MTSSTYDRLRAIKRKVTGMVKAPEVSSWPIMPYKTVDLVYWRPKHGTNFGDELGRTIVELMLGRRGITVFDETPAPRKLLTVGSILHFANDGTTVWGSGRNGAQPDRAHFFNQLDVRAVRGPRTREFLQKKGIAVPEIYGDPALLLPLLCGDRFTRTPTRKVALIPNLNDYGAGIDFSKMPVPVIDPRVSWNHAIAEILKCEFVIASSLHGLIVAEAYGIPARYVRLSPHEGLFKYEDYYLGSGRSGFTQATSVEEALEMGGEPPINFDAQALMNAFPYDIWLG